MVNNYMARFGGSRAYPYVGTPQIIPQEINEVGQDFVEQEQEYAEEEQISEAPFISAPEPWQDDFVDYEDHHDVLDAAEIASTPATNGILSEGKKARKRRLALMELKTEGEENEQKSN